MSRGTTRLRIGRRRQILIMLPVALLLLALVSAFTLVAYRQGIDALVGERQREAERLAERLARSLAGDAPPQTEELGRAVPADARMALVAPSGRVLLEVGALPRGSDLVPAVEGLPERPIARGPDARLPDRVVALAPTQRRGERLFVRVDLPAVTLAGQRRGLSVLTWVVVAVNFGVFLLLLAFLRRLLAPYERLLATAREIEPTEQEPDDEMGFLVSTFERAVEALRQGSAPSARDDIAALERMLGSSLESGLLLLDRNADVLALNAFGAVLLAVEPPSTGAPLATTLADHPELLAIISAAAEEGRSVQRREAEVVVGGERRTLGLTVHPLRRDDGSVRGSLVLFVDLTQIRRQADEQKLARGLEQIGEFTAGLAHEMRNGMATLRGYLTLIERAPDEGAITDYLSEIRRESDHLHRVLEDFLSFARPGSTRMEPIDLERVLDQALSDPVLRDSRFTRRGGGAMINGDEQLLERALRNLLHNAVEAQREAGNDEPIAVRVEAAGDEVALVIEDRGTGLPAGTDVFQPFVTASSGGVGMGLALARRIVDLHGGQLTLENRAHGGARARAVFRVRGGAQSR